MRNIPPMYFAEIPANASARHFGHLYTLYIRLKLPTRKTTYRRNLCSIIYSLFLIVFFFSYFFFILHTHDDEIFLHLSKARLNKNKWTKLQLKMVRVFFLYILYIFLFLFCALQGPHKKHLSEVNVGLSYPIHIHSISKITIYCELPKG